MASHSIQNKAQIIGHCLSLQHYLLHSTFALLIFYHLSSIQGYCTLLFFLLVTFCFRSSNGLLLTSNLCSNVTLSATFLNHLHINYQLSSSSAPFPYFPSLYSNDTPYHMTADHLSSPESVRPLRPNFYIPCAYTVPGTQQETDNNQSTQMPSSYASHHER